MPEIEETGTGTVSNPLFWQKLYLSPFLPFNFSTGRRRGLDRGLGFPLQLLLQKRLGLIEGLWIHGGQQVPGPFDLVHPRFDSMCLQSRNELMVKQWSRFAPPRRVFSLN